MSIRRIITGGLLLFSFVCMPLAANPLLGGGREKPVPTVRPPSSPGFMMEQQMQFRERMGELISRSQEQGGDLAVGTVLALAFLYGLLHAAGPGHRKTVIFSLFLSGRAYWFEPAAAAALAAAAHGGSALFLVLLFRLLFDHLVSVRLNTATAWLEGISYILLAIFALFFLVRAIAHFRGGGHGHASVRGGRKGLYLTLLSSGIFPCPGVIMVLSFCAAMGVLKLGILAVISLSAGMGVTISLAGYLAYFGRAGLFSLLKERELLVGRIAHLLEAGSYLFLLSFSLWMAQPFLYGLYFSFAAGR